MNISEKLASELSIRVSQAESVIRLIDEGNTIPFIARYRKELTGGLEDDVLRPFEERLTYLRNLEERKASILSSIDEQGKLTDALRTEIDAADTAVKLEDLYRPYKPKRRTRAMMAKERGLQELAEYLGRDKMPVPVEKEAAKYINPEKDVPDVKTAIQGAEDILAEDISDNADFRAWIRRKTWNEGVLLSTARSKEISGSVTPYSNYYDYSEPVRQIPGHRTLAINRGEKEKILTVKIEAPAEDCIRYLENHSRIGKNPVTDPYRKDAISDSYQRLIAPSIETDIRNELTTRAEDGAMQVFAANLRELLMQPPIVGKTVLGWDPGYRNGCKIAVVDPTGKVLDTTIIYPTKPAGRVEEAMRTIGKLIEKDHVDLIALGNGTASRESEQIIADFLSSRHLPVKYVIVNEAGASVYSASKLGAEEFPNFTVEERGAVSMARRLQDPLAELVKIEPQAIGVGQYQHDMNQTKLSAQLGNVVEDCVNAVGVDVNTASAVLLEHVSGINKTIAKNIVNYRETNGSFQSRRQLLKVPKLGPKAFEQCAGFLRIRDGKEVLDNTAVHPESYEAADKLLKLLGFTETDVRNGKTRDLAAAVKKSGQSMETLAAKTGVGVYTLSDIITELQKPGRDPRDNAPAPILRSDILDFNDLKPGMELKGTVRNIVDFGAFVDIGVHQDGLVHISQLADHYVKHPLDVVHVGDIVDVRVLSVDPERKKISLTMRKQK